MRFGVLGILAVWTRDGKLAAVPEAKVRALLADLILHHGRPVSTDRLIDDLWGDEPPVNPVGALQSKVSRLRQALENAEPGSRELVAFRPPGYLLRVEGDAVDEGRFAALTGQARANEDPRGRAALLADALALWRGPPLADFADAAFAQLAVARLEERRLVALEDQAEAWLTMGEHSLLAGELGDLVARHPLRERLRAAHMLALYRAGRQGDAVDSYRVLRSRLAGELGLDPGPDLVALHQAILEQAPGLLGVPAPATLAARPRTNMPATLTDVIGRAAAVDELRALLRERRLVTLTGPGGVGKTRLALETAAQSADVFPDGVWLVELDALGPGDAGSPADVVMTVLGIREDTAMDAAGQLAEALRTSRMLLILDNCEHLIEETAMRLHEAGEFDLLRLRHQRFYTALAETAAPRLRGHDQRNWLRRLDVETANLRSSLASAIQDDDASAAIRIVNALAWYWFLRGRLIQARRALGEALALGHGSASALGHGSASARAMAMTWQAGFAILTGERGATATAPPPLGEIDDPVMRATAEWFHGFVASDFGDPSVGETLVGRALARFRALGDQWGIAAALSTRAKQAMMRGDLAAVHRDAQQSLAIFRELGDRWGQLQATEWLGALEAATGDHRQASRLHRDGLRMAEDLSLWPQAADALSWLGRSALRSGDLAQARELLERGMRLAAEQSYQPGQVFAEIGLGLTARREGKLDIADSHLRNVLQSSRRIGSEPDTARLISLSELGFIAEQRGDPATARTLHLECLSAARKLGDPRAIAQALTGLAGAQALAGQPDRAARLLGAADTIRRTADAGLPSDETGDVYRITAATRRALGEAAFAAGFQQGQGRTAS